MRLGLWQLAVGVAALAGMLCVPAHAQEAGETQTAAARGLFEQGLAAVDEGDLARAADRFERSLELRESPVVAYNLALALIELGRLVEASEHLRSVVRDGDAAEEVRSAAERRLEKLLPRLAELTLVLEGDPSGVEVRLDGEPVPDPVLGVAQPADPGRHVAVASRRGERLDRGTATLEPGSEGRIRLRAPPAPEPEVASPSEAAQSAAADPTAPPPEQPEGDDDRLVASPWLWTAVAVVVVAAGATAIALTAGGGEPMPVEGDTEPPVVELP